jgi:hypothetical protein
VQRCKRAEKRPREMPHASGTTRHLSGGHDELVEREFAWATDLDDPTAVRRVEHHLHHEIGDVTNGEPAVRLLSPAGTYAPGTGASGPGQRAAVPRRRVRPTSMAAIAEAARISVDTIYKTFGGKPGLVRAIVANAIEGEGPIPAEQRSDRLQADEPDPRRIIAGWGHLVAELAPEAPPSCCWSAAPPAPTPSSAACSARSTRHGSGG